ncbi:hypothetical protein [Sphingobacterium hotanense]|uniref:hypothetical protein n=1 Tax=Sphingobacterium hotanense TaxID=649196 RepID=UPI0021A9307F|nr:hypothetical protein [Sphingobacterium hotanense]MCT1523491.1 hypothetical protein [Sphingobacterium hotanense]
MNLKRFSTLICIEVIMQEFMHQKYPIEDFIGWVQRRVPVLEDSIALVKKELENKKSATDTDFPLNEGYYIFYQQARHPTERLGAMRSSCPSEISSFNKEYAFMIDMFVDFIGFFEKHFSMNESLFRYSAVQQMLLFIFDDISQTVKLLPHHALTAKILDGCVHILSIPGDNLLSRNYDYAYCFFVFKLGATWDWHRRVGTFAAVERFVIYLNFNAEGIVNYFLEKVSKEVGQMSQCNQRITVFLDYRRFLARLPARRKTTYDMYGMAVKKHLVNWIEAELKYLYEAPSVGLIQKSDVPKSPVPLFKKVICRLSGDQLAIVLRAADEVKMVESRSLNMVYNTMIPYIATENRTTLSPSSIRVKSYYPEQKDKNLVIDKLSQMIEKIKDY